MNVNITSGIPGATYKVTSTDTAALAIAAAKLDDTLGRRLKALLIENDQATGYGLRYAFGGTSPSQTAGVAMHFLAAGSTLTVEGYSAAESLRIISATAGEHAILWITPYY